VALFFPDDLRRTPLEPIYLRLTPIERLYLLREFVGVTYRRRFLFYRDTLKAKPSRRLSRSFRHNLSQAAARQYRALKIGRRCWRRWRVRPHYLRLLLRHYLFGYLVQGVRPHLAAELLALQDAGCYYDFIPNLAAIIWFNHNRAVCERVLEGLCERIIGAGERRLYVYALLVAAQLKELVSFADVAATAARELADCSRPGRTPLGVELEFSNLGRFATFDQPFGAGRSDPVFENMRFYEGFCLDDVTWRLGGYLDTHIRGWSWLRRLGLGGRTGGFFEYSLVRLDYPRALSLPLSTDCGLVARYIDEVIAFVSEIKPHSLHLNLEKVAFGRRRPVLDDYLCLLLLGGDLRRDAAGNWRETRLADGELRGVIQRRRHRPGKRLAPREVVEYSFLRLKPPCERDFASYLPLLLAFKGFQYGLNLDLSCRDQVQGMLAWAYHPRPLSRPALSRFLELLDEGWQREGSLGRPDREVAARKILALLELVNQRIGS
jgi:hypothetical protein